MLKDIAFVAYPAKNVAQLREWYQQTLGVPFDKPFLYDGVEQLNEANVGSGYFVVMLHEWLDRAPGTGAGVAFEVDDIEKTIADLRAKGVTVEDVFTTAVCKLTSFQDPEGNKVTLHQITVPH